MEYVGEEKNTSVCILLCSVGLLLNNYNIMLFMWKSDGLIGLIKTALRTWTADMIGAIYNTKKRNTLHVNWFFLLEDKIELKFCALNLCKLVSTRQCKKVHLKTLKEGDGGCGYTVSIVLAKKELNKSNKSNLYRNNWNEHIRACMKLWKT